MKTTHGGKRKGAGRKRCELQKKQISFRVPIIFANDFKTICKKILSDFNLKL